MQRITFFKLGKHRHSNSSPKTMSHSMRRRTNYNKKNLYRFDFKSTDTRNNALKIQERNGFDYDHVEDLKSYEVEAP